VSFGAKYEADLLRQSYKENKEGVAYLKSLLMVDGYAPGTVPMGREEKAQYHLKMLPQLPGMPPDRAQQIMGEFDSFAQGEEGHGVV